MPDIKANLLIVDDAPSIRVTLSQIFASNGYSTRSAEEGFTALTEIRREIPDFLISDLNMSGMSGFELLRVVRREFPSIRVIAMSGAFSGDQIPPGVLADAFYQKGRGCSDLLKMLKSLPPPARWTQQPSAAVSSVCISKYERNVAGEGYVTIECSECLRTFAKFLNGAINPIDETTCVFCGSQVCYTVLLSDDQEPLLPFGHARTLPSLQCTQELDQ